MSKKVETAFSEFNDTLSKEIYYFQIKMKKIVNRIVKIKRPIPFASM